MPRRRAGKRAKAEAGPRGVERAFAYSVCVGIRRRLDMLNLRLGFKIQVDALEDSIVDGICIFTFSQVLEMAETTEGDRMIERLTRFRREFCHRSRRSVAALPLPAPR